MSTKGVGRLHFINGKVDADKYIDILEKKLLPSIHCVLRPSYDKFIFQQDGASCQTAKKTMKWLNTNCIPVLEWPSNSPDLSPIEDVWRIMKKNLRKEPQSTVEGLRTTIQKIWNSITPEQCEYLLKTMHSRVRAVIAAKGDATKF